MMVTNNEHVATLYGGTNGKYGYIIFHDGLTVAQEKPIYTMKEASERMADWLQRNVLNTNTIQGGI